MNSSLIGLGIVALLFSAFCASAPAQSQRAQEMIKAQRARMDQRMNEMRERSGMPEMPRIDSGFGKSMDEIRAEMDAQSEEMRQQRERMFSDVSHADAESNSAGGSRVRIRGRTIRGALILLGLLGAGLAKVFGLFGGGQRSDEMS